VPAAVAVRRTSEVSFLSVRKRCGLTQNATMWLGSVLAGVTMDIGWLSRHSEFWRHHVARLVTGVSIGHVFGQHALLLLGPLQPGAQHQQDRDIRDGHDFHFPRL
jgi:hypothetical protein